MPPLSLNGRSSQSEAKVPHYQDLLDFIDLRAQASEGSAIIAVNKPYHNFTSEKKFTTPGKPLTSFTSHHAAVSNQCIVCRADKHPLYVCPKFQSLPHDQMVATLKDNNLCMNCLSSGHVVKNCKSVHKCHKCQKPHHTLLHKDKQVDSNLAEVKVSTSTAVRLKSNLLLMTCRIVVYAPDGSSIEARVLLDSASSASFVSERLIAQGLCLPRFRQNVRISGIGDFSHDNPVQHISSFKISAVRSSVRKIGITAIVVPKVTCDLPTYPVRFDSSWKHLTNLVLADPNFGQPGKIDLLLGADLFADVLRQGRRSGPAGSPVAFETEFGWVLSGRTESIASTGEVAALHTIVGFKDDILHKFWEIEEGPTSNAAFSLEERSVLSHFKDNHFRTEEGFMVSLPKRLDAKQIGESRTQAVRRFFSLERSLNAKGLFQDFSSVMTEYMDLGHAELVPLEEMEKPTSQVFYLPMHVVYKNSSTTTKIRAVFDASAKSSSGVSLNDILLVGPTVHSTLMDVLLRFRMHRIAITADINKMYRAVQLVQSDRDFHRFVWRSSQSETLKDYRMTRVTFGVSASSFAANMCVKQNAMDFATKYPLAAKAVEESFYVDDCLTGADSVEMAIKLQQELQCLLSHGGFLLRKWNSSNLAVLQNIDPDIRDSEAIHHIHDGRESTKTLGLEWNTKSDEFCLTVNNVPPPDPCRVTKRALVSDIAKTFDVLGWFSPTIIKMKILLQKVWELKVDWDDSIPDSIRDIWLKWRTELFSFANKSLPRCYYPKEAHIVSFQLHGFSDASEDAYAAVVYLRMVDTQNNVYVSLVMSKTKVAPIKRLTIPRLELCGAQLLSQLLHHLKALFGLPLNSVHAYTDSTIVLNWLTGSPRRFKTIVGNRIAAIVDCIPPDRWEHVAGIQNPADCASRGLFPSELICNDLWWNGPSWLKSIHLIRPKPEEGNRAEELNDEEREICLTSLVHVVEPIICLERYSSYTRLKRITAWCLRFINNCLAKLSKANRILLTSSLTSLELHISEGILDKTCSAR